MTENSEKQGEKPENQPVNGEENTPILGFDSKKEGENKICNKPKEYKYHRINLVLNEERYHLLKDCCDMAGLSSERIDQHDQDVIWELLAWVEPLFRFRSKIRDIVRDLGFKEVDLK
jgi:hypothetical protein